MSKSSGVIHQKAKRFSIPKAAEGDTPMMSLRLPAETREAVDKWAATQEDRPGRSEAIRRLLIQALGIGPKRTKRRKAD
jgi:Arc/MetJ-type ribon-helix-helix transcriptional regulator